MIARPPFTPFWQTQSSAAFSPTDIAGLQLWLKASSLSLSDGDPVSTWTDSSGNGNNAAQATTSKKPTYKASILNSLPVVRFDGVDDYLEVTHTSGLALNADSSVFVVLKTTRSAASGYGDTILSKDANAASAGAYYLYLNVSNKLNIDRPYVAAGTAATNALSANTFYLISAHISGTAVSYFRNAAANGTQTLATGTSTAQPLRVCAFSDGTVKYFFSGDVAELLIYNTAVSSTDRQNVETYLNGIYALY